MLGGQAPGGPVGIGTRRRFQRVDNHRFDGLIGDGAFRSRPGRVAQPFETLGGEAAPPLAHRGRMYPLAGGHLAVGGSLGAGQHNPRPLRQRLGRRVAPYPTLQRLAFGVAQLDGRCRSSPLSHDVPPMLAHIERTRTDHENSRSQHISRRINRTGH